MRNGLPFPEVETGFGIHNAAVTSYAPIALFTHPGAMLTITSVIVWLVYKAGGGTQVAISHSTIGTSDTQTQCVFRVPDLRAAIIELRARGVKVEEYDEPTKTDDGICDMGHSFAAWIIDPSRNVLGVVQPKG